MTSRLRPTIARLAALPFDAHPGEKWVYGYGTDILGALVERVSGQSLEMFLSARIFAPLAMRDTHFYLPDSKAGRLTTVYSAGFRRTVDEGARYGRDDQSRGVSERPAQELLGRRRAALNGQRLRPVPPDAPQRGRTRRQADPQPAIREVDDRLAYRGIEFNPGQGFGLGFGVVQDVGERGLPGSVGEFGWGGAYHSTYWVDPAEKLVVVYMTQLLPAGTLDDQAKLRALVYQAIVD